MLFVGVPAWTNLDPGGVTVEETPTLKSAKNSQKVKSRDYWINECVPLICGVHAYL